MNIKEEELETISVVLNTITSSIGLLHMELTRLDTMAASVSDALAVAITEGIGLDQSLEELEMKPNDFCMSFERMAAMAEHLADQANSSTQKFVKMLGAEPNLGAESSPEAGPN